MAEELSLPSTMIAVCLSDTGPRVDTAYPVPQLHPHEAIVRVRLAGVCATDLQLVEGYKGGYRGVMGHEFVGEVVRTGPEYAHWLGKRVAGELNIGCGACALCRRGLGKHCRARQSLGIIGRDGAFADYLALPVANLHAVPDSVKDEAAVFVEPLAAALQILEQVHIGPDQRVFVVGDGRLGQLISRVLALTGCELTVLGRHPAKLALLDQAQAGRTLHTSNEALDTLAADPADVVVEATGHAQGFAAARRLVRPGGTLVLKSTFAGGQTPIDLSSLVVDEVRLVGSRCGPFAPALRLLASGHVEVEPLISAHYNLKDALHALAHAGRRGVLKVLLRPGNPAA